MPVNEVRSLSTNPLKSSQPLGAAYAFLGIEGAMPLLHGSQGCTAFALVLFVRHFKETIPIQTTAMSEVSTILGGADHLEEAILNIRNRAKPSLIGICTTALVETRGEDFAGDLAAIRERRAEALGDTRLVLASTPDFGGSIEEGWSKAVTATIDTLTRPRHGNRRPQHIALLPGVHLSVGDIELLRDTVEAFGLTATILPDVSGALDGTLPGRWIPTSYGGTAIADIENLGEAVHAIAIGEHMRAPAEALHGRAGVPYTLLPTLTGLEATDRFLALLSRLSGQPVPARLRRRRSQLLDAMLDGHFHFGGRAVAAGNARLSAEGEVDGLQKQLDQLPTDIRKKIVEMLNSEINTTGGWVYEEPGQGILEILDDSALELEFIVPSRWMVWLKDGYRFQVKIDETGGTYPAKVIRLGAKVDPVSQSVKTIAVIDGQFPDLIAGMSGRVQLAPPASTPASPK